MRRSKPASFLLRSLLLGTLFHIGCSEKSSPSQTTTSAPPAEKPTELTDNIAASYEETLPQIGVSDYIGSQSCIDCHKDEHTSWHRTYHRTMTQIATPTTVVADFNNVVLTNDNTRFTLLTKTNELWVRMEPISGEGVGHGVETRMGLVTGSHHMQVFWVPEGTGNLQIGFPFTWLIPEKRWVSRNATFIRPPGFDHRPEPWNIVCSRCHTTAVEPRFQASTRTVDTHVGELGISCEACHGPARKHVELRRAASSPLHLNLKASPSATARAKLEPNEIIHPEKLSAERSSQTCGFCHSMKWIDHSEDWRHHGFRFRPGDDLEKTTPIIRASSTNSIPGLADYLARNPELLRDFFWSDGMIRVSGREFNGLIESPCYKGGKFSCLSCHSGHDNQPDDMLSERGKSNTACLQCHEKFNEPAQLTAHTRHSAKSSGSECYNCHMPHTTYGVLKGIRSHQISSPRVVDDLQTGRPNACNLCHLDQTLDWTAQNLKSWYNQEVPKPPAQTQSVSHLLRLALAGDAGQRALAAWHFGWPEAQRASGTNWIAPVLAQLLDDPYAAVRLVAERSARTINLLPENYEFATDPASRASVRDEILKKWLLSAEQLQFSPSQQNRMLVWPQDQERQAQAFQQLLNQRDYRSMRLRE